MATGLAIHGKGNEALELLDVMEGSGIKPNAVTFTGLLSACCHSGLLEEGLYLFHLMKSKSLLSACNLHGDVAMGDKVGKKLLRIQSAQSSAQSTLKSEDYFALSNIYASAERWEDVEMVRQEIKVKGIESKAGCSSVQTSSR
ncbi:pentatricopeptide repeat-containing protein [Pyrus ussuriensis x Pyrus communis]|uniref:Pentatricopeptide repeat-containing protein n=1 Tax=Pyrus ussuriensis x Pyrus communis TaxID=2448454 RepID=A0A5N5H5I0_9ROSA|nr:pentatricopeptide repeat-containing protein [Pyrus ussuriensis x Pyrus communis]